MFKKTTLHLSSSKRFAWLLLFFTLLSVSGCKDGFDEYWQYDKAKEGFLLSRLQENPRFSTFVRALERTGLANTMSRAGVYTVFAPTNEAFQTYLTAKGKTIENIDEKELTELVNYHLAYFTYFHFDFQRRYKANNNNVSYLNRAYKFLRVTTDLVSADLFKVNDVNVSIRDIAAENGVIHGIDQVLPAPVNMDQAFNTRTEFTTLAKLLAVVADEVADPRNTFDKDGDGTVDSTFIKFHRYLAVTSNPVYLDLELRPNFGNSVSGVQQNITSLAPVNPALDAYLNRKQFDNNTKSILDRYGNDPLNLPLEFAGYLLQPHFLENNNLFTWAQILSPTAPLRLLSGQQNNSVIPAITPAHGVANLTDIKVSNGYIHGINRVLESERIQSALGKALVDPELRTFIRGLIKTGLFNTYAVSTASNTVFAPTNQAFIDAKLDVENLTIDGAAITLPTLSAILRYHIVNSEKRRAGTGDLQLVTGTLSTVLSRYGAQVPFTVNVTNNTVTGETNIIANITQYDLRGSSQTGAFNATTVHKIDKVLFPNLSL